MKRSPSWEVDSAHMVKKFPAFSRTHRFFDTSQYEMINGMKVLHLIGELIVTHFKVLS
jgi:hypothetical protein